jgi:thiamine-phosphate pyrophosphorylase
LILLISSSSKEKLILMKAPSNFGFYAILTSPLMGYEYCTRLLVDAGIRFVQLRIKDAPVSEVLPIAEKMRRITLGTNTRFIVNDYPEIAAQCKADGLHIGQDDLPYGQARNIMGKKAVIGISTHSPEQTAAACSKKPDYIGIGPVFPTPTKNNPDPVIGIEGMKSMLRAATVPSVVIGGIDLSNLHLVLEAGARNFCMVRQFTQSDSPASVLKKAAMVYNSYYPNST